MSTKGFPRPDWPLCQISRRKLTDWLTQFATSLDSKPKEFRNLAKRPKAVAWIVSHCDTESDRESYVRELKNHIQVSGLQGGASYLLQGFEDIVLGNTAKK